MGRLTFYKYPQLLVCGIHLIAAPIQLIMGTPAFLLLKQVRFLFTVSIASQHNRIGKSNWFEVSGEKKFEHEL